MASSMPQIETALRGKLRMLGNAGALYGVQAKSNPNLVTDLKATLRARFASAKKGRKKS